MPIQKASSINKVDVISSGLPIARAIGIGGLPKERIIEVVGLPGAGKSTACLQEVANAQKEGEKCLWVDGEGSFTSLYAEELGVDTETLDVLRGKNLEELLNEVLGYIQEEKYGLIVIDSIGQLIPRAVLEKAIGERTIGGQAYPIGQFVRQVSAIEFGCYHRNVSILGINQLQTDIMTGRVSGRGGESWNYHKAVSVEVKKKPGVVVKQGENVIGYVSTFKVREKNKMKANVGFSFDAKYINGQGFSGTEDIIQQALDAGILTKEGNSHFFSGEKLGTISKVRTWIQEPENLQKLKDALV